MNIQGPEVVVDQTTQDLFVSDDGTHHSVSSRSNENEMVEYSEEDAFGKERRSSHVERSPLITIPSKEGKETEEEAGSKIKNSHKKNKEQMIHSLEEEKLGETDTTRGVQHSKQATNNIPEMITNSDIVEYIEENVLLQPSQSSTIDKGNGEDNNPLTSNIERGLILDGTQPHFLTGVQYK